MINGLGRVIVYAHDWEGCVVPVLDGSFLGDQERVLLFDVTLVCPQWLALVNDVYHTGVKGVAHGVCC